MADVQAKNMEHMTKQQTAKAKAMVDTADIASKMKLEQMRLKQSEIVHRSKLTQAEKSKQQDIYNNNVQKGLDLDEARRRHELDLAHDDQQAAAKQLHEIALENQRQKLAEQSQLTDSE
jgi:hypothetical protein